MNWRLIVTSLYLSLCGISVNALAGDADIFKEATRLKNQGQYNKANYYYFKSIDENKNIDLALYELSDSFYASGKYETSLKQIDRLLEVQPNHHNGILLRSRIYVHKKQYTEALNDLQYLEKNAPTSDVYSLLDSVHTTLGNTGLADKAKARHRALLIQGQGNTKD